MIQELLHPAIGLFFLDGLLVTLHIAVSSIVLSLIFGTVLGVAQYSQSPLYSRMATFYIDTVRNIPLLLFILVARFTTGLPPVHSGIFAMTVFTSAVIAEIIRGGLNSVHRGQWEAARSQGLSYYQTLRHIVLPQAFRNVIPPLLSQFTTVIKDTSFVWAVGVEELTGRGMIIMGKYGSTSQVFAIFGAIAATYFVVNYLLSLAARYQHGRLAARSY
ncbi:amino acid ABC transporter permease [Acetonema longum]|uniref:Polar amino acid ABC transporter inner membrane subunit n=1 Tax=Acetonema longum DSM 6540 TaxID=1009370 RepID=F7NG83_9FIRM|nr:amino acid ABC transporter permease [Acetonema longum]EGO65001.1 polar amino acid ABC transporter inner membrane subunit [Acetonema longum DSM 6540]